MATKPKLPVMLDSETLSLKSNAAIIDVAFGSTQENVTRILIRPESYTNSFDFDVNSETIAFHTNQKTGIMEHAEAVGVSWRKAAQQIHEALSGLARNYELHLWCKGKDADIPWLTNLLNCADLKVPWHYNRTHCLRDLGQLYPEVKQPSHGNHTANRDVIAQLGYLNALCAYDDRVYRMVWGD